MTTGEKIKRRVVAFVVPAAWMTIIAGGSATLMIEWSRGIALARANAVSVKDHEQRLRVIEHDVSQIATDVRWIRQALTQGDD